MQADRSVAAVHDTGGAGDHILLRKHTVEKLRVKPGCGVGKCDAQRLALLCAVRRGGESLQRIFPRPDLMSHIAQIRAELSQLCFGVQGAQAKIAAVCAAVFLRHGIQRPAAVILQFIRVWGKAAVALEMQVIEAALRPPSVIEMQQVAKRADLHLIACVFCCQRKGVFFIVKDDAHRVSPPYIQSRL